MPIIFCVSKGSRKFALLLTDREEDVSVEADDDVMLDQQLESFRINCFNVILDRAKICSSLHKMNMAKTAISHSGSSVRSPLQARGPWQGPTSPMPRATSEHKCFSPAACSNIDLLS